MNILNLMNATRVFVQIGQTKISSKLAYKIMKFCKSVAADEEFYNNKRNEIINEYAVRDENGAIVQSDDGVVNIIQDKIPEANAALMELNGVEVEAPNIKFSLSELEELKLSVADMFALDAFIEE